MAVEEVPGRARYIRPGSLRHPRRAARPARGEERRSAALPEPLVPPPPRSEPRGGRRWPGVGGAQPRFPLSLFIPSHFWQRFRRRGGGEKQLFILFYFSPPPPFPCATTWKCFCGALLGWQRPRFPEGFPARSSLLNQLGYTPKLGEGGGQCGEPPAPSPLPPRLPNPAALLSLLAR